MTEPDRNLARDLARVTEAADGAETHTVVMRSRTGTVRFNLASHRFDRSVGSPMPTTR